MQVRVVRVWEHSIWMEEFHGVYFGLVVNFGVDEVDVAGGAFADDLGLGDTVIGECIGVFVV